MPGRKFSSYRYGFGGQEKDDEVNEITGSSYTAEFWQYDSRLGRRWNMDPVNLHFESRYSTFGNNPVINIDPKGDEWGSSVDDDGNVSYSPEKGDNFKTFTEQYKVSDKKATELFKEAGLSDYLPQSKTVDKTLFGYKYGEEKINTYKSFGGSSKSKLSSSNLFKMINISSATNKSLTNHLQSIFEYSHAKSASSIQLDDYFKVSYIDGFNGSTALGFKGSFNFDGEKVPFKFASFSGRKNNYSLVNKTPRYATGHGETSYYRFDNYNGGGYEGLTITFDKMIISRQFELLEKNFGW